MKKFIIEKEFLDIFPEAKIGVILCKGIDNTIKDEDKYAAYLKSSQQEAMKHIENPEFIENPIIKTWREAFYKFKTKKGARCSIEALLKRVSKGNDIGTINPLVDIYNGISLKYGVPVGGENIDVFEGDMRLTVAEGGEEFITLGSDKSEPPYPGEVVYKDDAGAICRCFNWRESVRTMLTEDTVNAFMCIETVDGRSDEELDQILASLQGLIENELGGVCSRYILSAELTEIAIEQ